MTDEAPATTPADTPEEAPADRGPSSGSGWRDKRLLFLLGGVAIALAALAAVLISNGSGGGSSALSPKVLRHRVEVQFLLELGGESEQGRLLAESLPRDSEIACWQEETDRVCAAAVPKSWGSGALVDDFSKWTFYRATFPVGSREPEVEAVEPEDALHPAPDSPSP